MNNYMLLGGDIGGAIQQTERTVTAGDRVEINCDATGW